MIGGHRTTYGGPFERLDELALGDQIVLDTVDASSHSYRVIDTAVVDASLDTVLALDVTDRSLLTLFTCHPKWSTRERLVVTAELVGPDRPAEPARHADDGAPARSNPTGMFDLADDPTAPPGDAAARARTVRAAATATVGDAGPAWWRLAMWAALLIAALVGANWWSTGRRLLSAPAWCVVLVVVWPFVRALNDVAVAGGWLIEWLAP